MNVLSPFLIAHKADERFMSIAYRFYRRRERIVVACLAKVSFDTHLHAHDWSHMHASKLWHASIVYIDLFVRTLHPLVILSNRKMAGINTNASVQSTKGSIEGFFCVCGFCFLFCVLTQRNDCAHLVAMSTVTDSTARSLFCSGAKLVFN